MLADEFTSVMRADSPEQLLQELLSFIRRLGFSTVSATAVVDRFQGESQFIAVDNTPNGFREIFEDPAKWARDPVMQHCKHNSVPIVWHQETYVHAGQGEMWEQQAAFGYRAGITLAMHLPAGLHFCLGVDRDQPLPTDAQQLTRMTADIQLFAVYAQEAAFRVLLPPKPKIDDIPSLTPRELESLRWTLEGKTAWELGRILNISEQTAVKHVNNATHKLGCVSKHQAVLKALRLGLIH